MGSEEVNELQKEWRAIVLDKLTSLDQGQKDLRTDIMDIKTTFVNQQALETLKETNRTEIKELRDKVDSLEKFKFKLIGMAIVFQLVFGLIVIYFERLPK